MENKKPEKWEDDLAVLYSDFFRRNDLKEWEDFLDGQDMDDPRVVRDLGNDVWLALTGFGNIRQEVVLYLESVFHFCSRLRELEISMGRPRVSRYIRVMLAKQEIPSYHGFDFDHGDFEGSDYDEYIDTFTELLFRNTTDMEGLGAGLEKLRSTGIKHSDVGLILSFYYFNTGDVERAIQTIDQAEDSYYKSICLGEFFAGLEDYESCEMILEPLLEEYESVIDGVVLLDLFEAKWYLGKKIEAVALGREFINRGHRDVLFDDVYAALGSMSDDIMKKAGTQDAEEWEMILLLEYLMMGEKFDEVTDICSKGQESGFDSNIWNIYHAEAAFAIGEYDTVKRIIQKLDARRKTDAGSGAPGEANVGSNAGSGAMSENESDRFDALRAKKLFLDSEIEKAYEIMDRLCAKDSCEFATLDAAAQMYMVTGRYVDAELIYSRLHYSADEEFRYPYLWAKALAAEEYYDESAAMLKELIEGAEEDEKLADTLPVDIPLLKLEYIEMLALSGAEDTAEQFEGMCTGDDSLYARYVRGMIMEQEDDCIGAEKVYRSVLEEAGFDYPDRKFLEKVCTRIFVMMGENDARVGKMLKEGEAILSKVPEAESVWILLGDLQEYCEESPYENIKCLEEGLKRQPFANDVRYNLILKYMETGDNAKAWEHCRKLLLYTRSMEAYNLCSTVAMEIGEYDKCLEYLEETEKDNEFDTQNDHIRADLLMHLGRFEDAMEVYDKILRSSIDPGEKDYSSIANCMCKNGRWDEALQLLKDAVETEGNEDHLYSLFRIQNMSGDFDGAAETAKMIRKEEGESRLGEDYCYRMAQVNLARGNMLGTAKYAETLIEPRGERLCAEYYYISGQQRSAFKLLKKRIKKNPGDWQSCVNMSLMLALSGKNQDAAGYAKQGLIRMEADPDIDIESPDMADQCQMALLMTFAGKDGVEDILNEILKRPTCADAPCIECQDAHFALGVYLAYNGRNAEAAPHLLRAAELDRSEAMYQYTAELLEAYRQRRLAE